MTPPCRPSWTLFPWSCNARGSATCSFRRTCNLYKKFFLSSVPRSSSTHSFPSQCPVPCTFHLASVHREQRSLEGRRWRRPSWSRELFYHSPSVTRHRQLDYRE